MSDGSGIVIVFNNLPALSEKASKVVDAAARELGFEILRRAKIYLTQKVYTRDFNDKRTEPTGALRESGYVRTYHEDNSLKSETEAHTRNPDVKFGVIPPPPSHPGEVHVIFGVEYAIYVEMGTRHMEARPYLQPAAAEVEALIPSFIEAKLKNAGF